MKKCFLILVLVFSLTYVQNTIKISSAGQTKCDSPGKGSLELILTSETPFKIPIDFSINLKGLTNIQATCSIVNLPTDVIKTIPDITKESLGSSFLTEQESNEQNEDTEYEMESTFISDETSLEDQEKTNGEVEISDSITDLTEDNQRRLSEEESFTVSAICNYDSPNFLGRFIVESAQDSDIKSDSEIRLFLTPCLSEEETEKKLNITLSFRQVNHFDLSTFSFMFFALSRYIIVKETIIKFYFYFMRGLTMIPKQIEASCSVEDSTSESSMGLFPVSFKCLFPEEEVTSEVTSLQIISSEHVAGLPTDEKLLNPLLVDESITKGEIKEVSNNVAIPSYITIEDEDIEFNVEKGEFNMTFPFSGGDIEGKIGKTFPIYLLSPAGVWLMGTIKKFINSMLIVEFAINGKIENQPLMWEQTIINVEGEELFVLPSYKTEAITTEGYNSTNIEEEEEEEEKEGKDKEQEKEGKEGKESEQEKEGKEGKESEQEKEKEEQKEEKEKETEELTSEEESSTNETQSDKITTDQTKETEQTGTTDEISPSEETPRTIEEAEKKAEIFISFRQLNEFKISGTIITFNLYTFITQEILAGEVVKLNVNLIGKNGMEEEAKEVECALENDVSLEDAETVKQGNFKCNLEGIDETQEYTSLRLNSTDDITGVPEDETLLNPVLTEEAIKNNQIKNCSEDASIPPTFYFDSIEKDNCAQNGQFLIKGSLSEEKAIAAKFTIPLTYPEGTSISCTYETEGILCVGDENINGTIITEQTIISNGADELFIFPNISESDVICKNGLEIKAEEKTQVDISFRQVSHIELINSTFYFFFAAFVNKNLEASYSIPMNVILDLEGTKEEREATCVLINAVTVTGEPIQGDFNCSLDSQSSEEIPVENLTISTNNEKIGGCDQLTKEEASPKATDDAIISSNSSEYELGKVVDYSLEGNKNIKLPSLKIKSFDLERCESRGKIKSIGTLSQKISEEMTFELPFSFPDSKVKCTIEPSDEIEDIEIYCKVQKVKKFGTFKHFIVEPRLLKKKKKEMLFIESSSYDYNSEKKCNNFNEIKLKRAKSRKNAPFTFLQFGRPSGYNYFFYMALAKKSTIQTFQNTMTFTSFITYKTSSRIRLLEETSELDLELSCDLNAETGNSGVLDCKYGDNTTIPVNADMDDDKLGGITEDTPVETNPTIDLSNITNLELLENTTSVEITNIETNNCSLNGSYKIEATAEKDLDFTNAEQVTIPFSTPDSEGLCSVNVGSDKITLTMFCENKEAFTASEIIISPVVIYDKNGTTPLFKINNSYTAPTQLSCAISDKSYLTNQTSDSGDDDSKTSSSKRGIYRRNSGGLRGGEIAAIVICCIAVIALVAITIPITRKLAKRKANSNSQESLANSTIQNLTINNQKQNIA